MIDMNLCLDKYQTPTTVLLHAWNYGVASVGGWQRRRAGSPFWDISSWAVSTHSRRCKCGHAISTCPVLVLVLVTRPRHSMVPYSYNAQIPVSTVVQNPVIGAHPCIGQLAAPTLISTRTVAEIDNTGHLLHYSFRRRNIPYGGVGMFLNVRDPLRTPKAIAVEKYNFRWVPKIRFWSFQGGCLGP